MNRAIQHPIAQGVLGLGGAVGLGFFYHRFALAPVEDDDDWKPPVNPWDNDPASETIIVKITPTTTYSNAIVATPKTFEISWDDPFIKKILDEMQKDHHRIEVLENLLQRNRVRVQKLELDILFNSTALPTVAQALEKGNLIGHFRQWLPLEGTCFDNAIFLFGINVMPFMGIIPWVCYNLVDSIIRKLSGNPSSSTLRKQFDRRIGQTQMDNANSLKQSKQAKDACERLDQKFDELLEKYKEQERELERRDELDSKRSSDHNVQMNALDMAMAEFTKNRDLLKDQVDAFSTMQNRIDTLEDDVKGLKSRVSGLEQETARLETIKTDKFELEDLKKEMTQLTQRVEEAELEKSLGDDFKKMESRLAKLEEASATTAKSDTRQILQQDYDKVDKRLSKLENETLRLEQVKLDKSHLEDVERLKSRLVKLEDDASRQDGPSNQKQKQADITSLQSRLGQLEQGAVRQATLDSLSARLKQLEKKVEEDDDVRNAQFEGVSDRFEPLEESIKQLDQLKNDAAGRKVDIDNLKWRVEGLEKSNLELDPKKIEARFQNLEADDIDDICARLKKLEEVDTQYLQDRFNRHVDNAVRYTDDEFIYLVKKVEGESLTQADGQIAPRELSAEPEHEHDSEPDSVEKLALDLAELDANPSSPVATEQPAATAAAFAPAAIGYPTENPTENTTENTTESITESDEQPTQYAEASARTPNANVNTSNVIADDDSKSVPEFTPELTKAQRESKRKNAQRKIARARKTNTKKASEAARQSVVNSFTAPETQSLLKGKQDAEDEKSAENDNAPEDDKTAGDKDAPSEDKEKE